jgi:hypothetical protein
MLGKSLITAASGAAGGAGALYIEDVMATYLYTGNSSTQTITNGIDLAGEGGLVWIKPRSGDYSGSHQLSDTARGANWVLFTNATNAQFDRPNGCTSFASTGFTLGTEVTHNGTGTNYASWTFRKAEKFFDVVTYVGDGTAGKTVAHNLGSAPGTIIVKCTDSSTNWQVYHRSLGATQNLQLNDTTVANTSAGRWNNTEPTASVFTLGPNPNVNASGFNYVAYLFAHDAGGFGDDGTESVIKCGSFTCDGSGLATVDLGWEPQWVLIKRTNSTSNWELVDTMRGFTQNNLGAGTIDNARLFPNLANAESGFPTLGLTSTGFLTAASLGASNTYIYIAIRRGPMKTPTDATEVFATQATAGATDGTATANRFTSNFPVDLFMQGYRAGDSAAQLSMDRLRGDTKYLSTSSTAAEATTSYFKLDDMDGIYGNVSSGVNSNICGWMFRRAPGFFDVVAYTGTGTNRTVSHNLGVTPELMIVKTRSNTGSWEGYHSTLGATKTIRLNSDGSAITTTGVWNDTAPTSSVFTVGTSGNANGSGYTLIAYLFASCPGVSKVGSYTGTGTTLQVDCGFTAGARFVLIKRTDSTGDWYVYDTARGIVSGNDSYLLLNSTAAEVTTTDYIDPYSAGFEISSTAPAGINASGGSFIYLAVA